ncbi:MAG: hypothetical protein ACI86S_002149 [Paracoccaceae bacterium]|jgi:hypothetical protein
MTSWSRKLASRSGVLAFAICVSGQGVGAQDSAELSLVRGVLAGLQAQSIRENVEYCCYIGFDAAGELIASPATRGDEGSCMPDDPVSLKVITASYHTHGAYSPNYYNEVPSTDDIEGDEQEGIDGYVATPGGRFWYVDSGDMVISQICGLKCLPSDSDFVQGDMGRIAQSYHYDDLVTLLDQ